MTIAAIGKTLDRTRARYEQAVQALEVIRTSYEVALDAYAEASEDYPFAEEETSCQTS